MSQVTVNDEPGQAYAGKVHSATPQGGVVSLLASELIFFGKLVFVAAADVAVGGAAGGPQTCALPTSAGEALLAKFAGGVSIADPSQERLRNPLTPDIANSAPFGAYPDESAVGVMRRGRLWVQTEVAVADISLGVFARVANAGVNPIASLGSFTPVNTADHEPVPEGLAWAGAATVDGLFFGLLNVNLPA